MKFTKAIAVLLGLVALAHADGHDDSVEQIMEECDMAALDACTEEIGNNPAYGGQITAFADMEDLRRFCGIVERTWECAEPILDQCPFDDIYQGLEMGNSYRFMCRETTLQALERNWDCVRSPEAIAADNRCNASMAASLYEMYMKYGGMSSAEIDRDMVDRDACMHYMSGIMCFMESGAVCGDEMEELAGQWARAAFRDSMRYHRCSEMGDDSMPESEPEDDSSMGGGRGSNERPESRCDFDGIMECKEDIMMKKGYDKYFDAFDSMDEVYDLCSVVPETAMCVERHLERCTFDEAFQMLEKKNAYQFMCRMDTLQGIAENFECISGQRQADNDRMCNASINRQMMEMYYQAMEENWSRDEQDMRACVFMKNAVDCFADGAMDACGGDASELYYKWAMASMKDSWEYHMCDMREETGGAGHVAAGVLSLVAALTVFA